MKISKVRLSIFLFITGIVGGIVWLACLPTKVTTPDWAQKEILRTHGVESDIAALEEALALYRASNRCLPGLGDGFVMELVDNGVLLKEDKDPWGYKYVLSTNQYDEFVIISRGEDGILGSRDDITNRTSQSFDKKGTSR